MRKLRICMSLLVCIAVLTACDTTKQSPVGLLYDEYLGQSMDAVMDALSSESADWKQRDCKEIEDGEWQLYEATESIDGVSVVVWSEFIQTEDSDLFVGYTKRWTFAKDQFEDVVALRDQIERYISKEFGDAAIKSDDHYAWNDQTHPMGLWNEFDEEQGVYSLFFCQKLEEQVFT